MLRCGPIVNPFDDTLYLIAYQKSRIVCSNYTTLLCYSSDIGTLFDNNVSRTINLNIFSFEQQLHSKNQSIYSH